MFRSIQNNNTIPKIIFGTCGLYKKSTFLFSFLKIFRINILAERNSTGSDKTNNAL